MSDADHLLIPFAGCSTPAGRSAMEGLRLPRLERLLPRLSPVPEEDGGGAETSLSMPHERALARELGWPLADGLLPFAAAEAAPAGAETGAGWGWVTPCHWRVGADHVFMHHPQDLQLDARESHALLEAMRPYFEEDGLTLAYDAPTRWLARGELLATLPCASLDRVAGRVVDAWMPKGDAGRPLRRLQQEMQMLLYTHPVNEERTRGGLLPVNSFWVSGNGRLAPGARTEPPADLHVTQALRHAALLQDWPAWAAAWHQLDEREFAQLEQALGRGQPVTLTLCGERTAVTFRSRRGGWLQRLSSSFGRRPAAHWLSTL